MTEIAHGQVWWADVDDDKIRPVVILTRGAVAPLLRRILVAPITSTDRHIATEVALGRSEGLRDGSVANLDNAMQLDRYALLAPMGQVDLARWPEFCRAMSRVIGCPTY